MKIDAIKTFCINPVYYNKLNRISFVGKTDSFEKSEYNQSVDKFYERTKEDLGIVSADDVKVMASRISQNMGFNKEDVYYTMGVLSQYSSYKSLAQIRNFMNTKDIKTVSNLWPLFEVENYNPNLSLSTVMNYIMSKNCEIKKDSIENQDKEKILFLDSEFLKSINKLPEDEKEYFYEDYVNCESVLPVYLNNFENGYNFLNQTTDFESFTKHILNKVKQVQKQTGKDVKDSLDLILNGKILKEIRKNNIDPYVLKFDIKASPEDIAKNLNPIIPSKNDIVKIIDDISNQYQSHDYKDNQLQVINFLNKMHVSVSPSKFCDDLKIMHDKIIKEVEKLGKSPNDIYYLVPSINKSYAPVNYQYFKINNIKNPKMTYARGRYYDSLLALKKMPDNAVIVILDDSVMSGASYLNEMFSYEFVADELNNTKSGQNIIFAPLVGTDYGINRIKWKIFEKRRTDKDKIVCAEELPNWDECRSKYSIIYKFQNPDEYPYMTSVVFPYMGPDSNCESLVGLYEKFFLNPYAQKLSITNMNFVAY